MKLGEETQFAGVGYAQPRNVEEKLNLYCSKAVRASKHVGLKWQM